MERHPLDPIALVCGLVTLTAGVVALLHQLGAFHLGAAAVTVLGAGVLGAAGIVGVVLATRASATDSATGEATGSASPDPMPPAP